LIKSYFKALYLSRNTLAWYFGEDYLEELSLWKCQMKFTTPTNILMKSMNTDMSCFLKSWANLSPNLTWCLKRNGGVLGCNKVKAGYTTWNMNQSHTSSFSVVKSNKPSSSSYAVSENQYFQCNGTFSNNIINAKKEYWLFKRQWFTLHKLLLILSFY